MKSDPKTTRRRHKWTHALIGEPDPCQHNCGTERLITRTGTAGNREMFLDEYRTNGGPWKPTRDLGGHVPPCNRP